MENDEVIEAFRSTLAPAGAEIIFDTRSTGGFRSVSFAHPHTHQVLDVDAWDGLVTVTLREGGAETLPMTVTQFGPEAITSSLLELKTWRMWESAERANPYGLYNRKISG